MLMLSAEMPPLNPLIQTVIEIKQEAVEPPPKIYTIEEKIELDFYNCEPERYIRKDTAECGAIRPEFRPKTTTTARVAEKPVRQARGASDGNLYAAGNCTYYAKSMRPDLPNNLGNADMWTINARAQGIPTGTTPKVGAIAQKGMHVVYVTGVNSDGTFNLSEWNYRNLYETTYRTVSYAGWNFIY